MRWTSIWSRWRKSPMRRKPRSLRNILAAWQHTWKPEGLWKQTCCLCRCKKVFEQIWQTLIAYHEPIQMLDAISPCGMIPDTASKVLTCQSWVLTWRRTSSVTISSTLIMLKKLEEMKPPGVFHDPWHAMDVPDSLTGDFLMPYCLMHPLRTPQRPRRLPERCWPSLSEKVLNPRRSPMRSADLLVQFANFQDFVFTSSFASFVRIGVPAWFCSWSGSYRHCGDPW